MGGRLRKDGQLDERTKEGKEAKRVRERQVERLQLQAQGQGPSSYSHHAEVPGLITHSHVYPHPNPIWHQVHRMIPILFIITITAATLITQILLL